MAKQPEFLAYKIETTQKRTASIRIIFPMYNNYYNEALPALSLTTLNERQVHLCQVYVA